MLSVYSHSPLGWPGCLTLTVNSRLSLASYSPPATSATHPCPLLPQQSLLISQFCQTNVWNNPDFLNMPKKMYTGRQHEQLSQHSWGDSHTRQQEGGCVCKNCLQEGQTRLHWHFHISHSMLGGGREDVQALCACLVSNNKELLFTYSMTIIES